MTQDASIFSLAPPHPALPRHPLPPGEGANTSGVSPHSADLNSRDEWVALDAPLNTIPKLQRSEALRTVSFRLKGESFFKMAWLIDFCWLGERDHTIQIECLIEVEAE